MTPRHVKNFTIGMYLLSESSLTTEDFFQDNEVGARRREIEPNRYNLKFHTPGGFAARNRSADFVQFINSQANTRTVDDGGPLRTVYVFYKRLSGQSPCREEGKRSAFVWHLLLR